MTNGQALLTLLEKLKAAGIDDENIDAQQAENGDLTVKVTVHQYSQIVITVSDYWRYPTVPCYFVNWNAPSGDFCATSGTPYVDRALFDLGRVWALADRHECKMKTKREETIRRLNGAR